jgi:hypothetical protein
MVSVPHNGTLFAIGIFTSNGWEEQPLNGRPQKQRMLYQGHCEKPSQCQQACELAQRMPLIVPLRHPYRVEESWKRRGEDLNRLMQCYVHMLDVIRPHVNVWVPLDAINPVRWEAHTHLNYTSGQLLAINWDKPVNVVHHTHATPLSSLDPSERMRDIRKHPLFVQYYGTEDR